VSGLGGTTLTEVNVISITPDVALSILNLLLWNDAGRQLRTHLLSFLLLVAPMVLQLLGPMSPAWVFVGLMFWLVLILMNQIEKISQLWKQSYDWELCFKRSVTNHRALVMLITCVAILAVDFHAFPRRFAKTEHFGTGMVEFRTSISMPTLLFNSSQSYIEFIICRTYGRWSRVHGRSWSLRSGYALRPLHSEKRF